MDSLNLVGFARYYNRRHDRRGYFWGDRFKSVIVDKGETLVNCLAYIDLNPMRAGLVDRPEDYRWNSLGHHLQTENKDQFLYTYRDIDFYCVITLKILCLSRRYRPSKLKTIYNRLQIQEFNYE